MASSHLLRRQCGALASAAGVLSLPGGRDTRSSPQKDQHSVPRGCAPWVEGPLNPGFTASLWAPTLKGSFPVSCEADEAPMSVKTLVRKKSKIATAENWTQKQNDISKHVRFEDLLAKNEAFKNAPKDLIKRLVDECGTKIFAKRGAKLISQNDINDKLFVVGHGALIVEIDEQAVAKVNSGESVGEQAVITSQKAKADVSVSSSSAYLLVIEKEGLMKVLQEHPQLVEDMLTIISRREVQNTATHLLQRIPSFEGCSQEFLETMSDSLKLVSFNKGDAAVLMDDSDDKGMFFIMTGEMGVYDAKGMISTLGANSFFGEAMLLSGSAGKRGATVQALSFVEAFQLSRKDFLKVATKYPKDMEQMKKMSRQRSAFLLNRKTSVRVTG